VVTFHKGDMWDRFGKVDLFCITTNNTIKKNGALVMERGITKEARDRLPGIDKDLARAIQIEFDLIVQILPRSSWASNTGMFQVIAAFQVKNHFREKANISLIEHSCYLLRKEILDRPYITVALNFPGIGHGGLERSEVLPIISILPDNVEIWEKE